jgi:hypothetical protein
MEQQESGSGAATMAGMMGYGEHLNESVRFACRARGRQSLPNRHNTKKPGLQGAR